MAYYLTAFNGVNFPIIQPITAMPTAPGMNGSIATLGGGYDAWDADQAPPTFPYPLQYRVTVVGSTAAAYMTTVNALRAQGRKRGYLYRTGQDGQAQRAAARLTRVDAQDTVETFGAVELAFDFDVWSLWASNWARGSGLLFDVYDGAGVPVYYFDTGLFFDAGALTTTITTIPQNVTVTNGGNAYVDDAIITIAAGSAAPITAVTVAIAALGIKWSWTGTLAINKSLVVDVGAWSVRNDGADAYAGFALDATHTARHWLRLAPGANTVVVTRTGGGATSTIDFDFADRWA